MVAGEVVGARRGVAGADIARRIRHRRPDSPSPARTGTLGRDREQAQEASSVRPDQRPTPRAPARRRAGTRPPRSRSTAPTSATRSRSTLMRGADRRARGRRRGPRRGSSSCAATAPPSRRATTSPSWSTARSRPSARLFDTCARLMKTVQRDPAAGHRAGARHRDRGRLPARRHLRPRGRGRRRALRHARRADRALLLDADGAAHARDRPQARAGDAAHRRAHRRGDRADWGLVNRRRAARRARRRGRRASSSGSPSPAR